MKLFKIGYNGYLVEDNHIVLLADIFSTATNEDGTPLEFTVSTPPDKAKVAAEEKARKEIGGELDQYRNWWVNAHQENNKLKEEIARLKEKVGA